MNIVPFARTIIGGVNAKPLDEEFWDDICAGAYFLHLQKGSLAIGRVVDTDYDSHGWTYTLSMSGINLKPEITDSVQVKSLEGVLGFRDVVKEDSGAYVIIEAYEQLITVAYHRLTEGIPNRDSLMQVADTLVKSLKTPKRRKQRVLKSADLSEE